MNEKPCSISDSYELGTSCTAGVLPLAKQWMGNIFLATFLSRFVLFNIFNQDLVGHSVKIIRNNQRLNVVLTLAIYKSQWEVLQLKIRKTENTKTVSHFSSKSFLRLYV